MQLLERITIEPAVQAKCSIIWLHGLGADGYDFEPIIPELGLPASLAVRFIFPHAPMRPVTLNNNFVMRAWYDIYGMDLRSKEDEKGIQEATQQIYALIEAEVANGIPHERIILAGFSQGGAIALHCGLLSKKPLGGILALSTYLPLRNAFLPPQQTMPIFMAHGTFDPIIPFALGQASKEFLQEQGLNVDWHIYPMEHGVCTDEIHDISQWLQKIFSAS